MFFIKFHDFSYLFNILSHFVSSSVFYPLEFLDFIHCIFY